MFLRVFKRVLVAVVALLFSVEGFGQYVSYSYRPMQAEGCAVYFSIQHNDNADYIVVMVRSDRLYFVNSATMMLRTFDDKVLKFEGGITSNETNTGGGVVIGNVVVPSTSVVATASFEVTREDMLHIATGVSKIRLNTVPIQHERTFRRDLIGKDLYTLYQYAIKRDDYF